MDDAIFPGRNWEKRIMRLRTAPMKCCVTNRRPPIASAVCVEMKKSFMTRGQGEQPPPTHSRTFRSDGLFRPLPSQGGPCRDSVDHHAQRSPEAISADRGPTKEFGRLSFGILYGRAAKKNIGSDKKGVVGNHRPGGWNPPPAGIIPPCLHCQNPFGDIPFEKRGYGFYFRHSRKGHPGCQLRRHPFPWSQCPRQLRTTT